MPDRRLRIDRLVVRMRGVCEPQARELSAGLGEAVLRQLNDGGALAAQSRTTQHIQRIDAGSVVFSTPDRVAAHLADAVKAHLPPKGDR